MSTNENNGSEATSDLPKADPSTVSTSEQVVASSDDGSVASGDSTTAQGGGDGDGEDNGNGEEGGGEAPSEPEAETAPAYTFAPLPSDVVRTLLKIGDAEYRLGCNVPLVISASEFVRKKTETRPKTDKAGKPIVDDRGAIQTETVTFVTDPGALPFLVFFIGRFGPADDHGSGEGFFRIVCTPKPNSEYSTKGTPGEEGFRPATYLVIDEPISSNTRVSRQGFQMNEQGFIEVMLSLSPRWLQTQFKWTDEYMMSVVDSLRPQAPADQG